MSGDTWDDAAPIDEIATWLLEASAGTGKTFQIASLYLRLVVEEDLPVQRVLAITFTEAATGELRDRIRARLRQALDWLDAGALHGPASPSDPAELAIARRAVSKVGEQTAKDRLSRALLHFDLAPISTIHGFSKRMLDEFAFDSGQEPNLELVHDPSEIRERIVDDALASLYAGADEAIVALFEQAGVSRSALLQVAKEMSGAIAPAVLPPPHDDPARAWWEAAAARGRDFAARSRALHAWWVSDAGGRAALAALVALADAKRLSKGRLASGKGWSAGPAVRSIVGSFEQLAAWIASYGRPSGAPEPGETTAPHLFLPDNWCDKAPIYVDDAGVGVDMREALAEEPAFEPIRSLGAYADEAAAFWASFAPLADFAARARAAVDAELARRRALSFDAMISRLAERVASDGGPESPIAARVRERYEAALVDEFQDTDAAQWRVLEAAFHGRRRLFLIGDPKQAIYAFRGADLHVYLDAKRAVEPARRRTMRMNFRSDASAVRAMNGLFREGSGAFDADAMDYVEVASRPDDRVAPPGPGIDLRFLDDRVDGGPGGGTLGSKDAVPAAGLAAREVLAWLRGERGALVDPKGERAPAPGDLAVLVSSHRQARAVREALERAGVPVVAASRRTVFQAEPARWVSTWLRALAGGSGADRAARDLAVTPLVGWRADELAWALAEAEEPGAAARGGGPDEPRDWAALRDALAASARRYERRGFAVAFDHDLGALEVLPRLLGLPGGERHATDLRHLAELAHVEERRLRHAPARLAAWLEARREAGDVEQEQRLESDAEAVKVETIHASKGLEYPIVLLPHAFEGREHTDRGRPRVVHDAGRKALDVASAGTAAREARGVAYAAEQDREELRKLYVALTRARHRTVAWYGPVGQAGGDPSRVALGRLLLRDPDATGFTGLPRFATKKGAAEAGAPSPADVARARLDALRTRTAGAFAWALEPALDEGDLAPLRAQGPPPSPASCAAWPAGREVTSPYGSTSFTALARHGLSAAQAPQAAAALAIEEADRPVAPAEDEAEEEAPAVEAVEVEPGRAEPAAGAPARLTRGRGTDYGNWIHGIFERLDFVNGRGKLGEAPAALAAEVAARLGYDATDAEISELEQALPALLDTPLDAGGRPCALAVPAGLRLRALGTGDRLDELGFGLRLGDGAAYAHDARAPSPLGLGARMGCVDPAAVYAALLDDPSAQAGAPRAFLHQLDRARRRGAPLVPALAGLLEGSIDLVFRAEVEGAPRHYVVDYKTNRVRHGGVERYDHDALEAKMSEAGYALQALLYGLALHRYLGQRLPGYDYDRHVGGHLYLFLRGMAGPTTRRDRRTGRCEGVVAGRFPRSVIEALDRALGGAGARAEGGAAR